MMPTLKIDISDIVPGQNFGVVKFSGSFDKAGHSDVREALEDFVKNFELSVLVFDFSDLLFINSEGIGYLMEIHTHLIQRDKKLVLIGLTSNVADVFETIGINEIITVFKDLDEFLNQNKN